MIFATERCVLREGLLRLSRGSRAPRSVELVQMKLVHHIVVEGRPEDAEVGVPLRSAEDQHMMRVHLADRRSNALVQRLELAVVLPELREMRNGLVEKVVTQHRRLVVVVIGDALPYRNQLLLVRG